MMTIKQIEVLPPERVHTLVGLFPEALAELLAVVLPEVDRRRHTARAPRPHRQRAPDAGRLRRDVDANLPGIAVILDMLDRLAALQHENAWLRSRR